MLSATSRPNLLAVAALGVCGGILVAGCGGSAGSGSAPTAGQKVAIIAQPSSETVPIGQTATFTVEAIGAAPLSYQWSEDGTAIPGATSASYTTPAVALASGGSTTVGSFQVTVGNASSSVASNSVTLTAGPRSPKPGDLRYLLWQQVDAQGLFQDGGEQTDVWDGSESKINNVAGTPLEIGSSGVCATGVEYDCGWGYDVYNLPSSATGLTMYYLGGYYSNFAGDLQSIIAPNAVISSLDFEPEENAYAISWVETAQAGGFDYRLEVVPQSQIHAAAAADGAESRVITAASFDASGNANLISYGWTGDTTTIYETQTEVVTPEDVAAAASALAGEGYIISAFGGNDTQGYMLIGMRVKGDGLPRPITGVSPNANIPAPNPNAMPYFTTVVFLSESGGDTAINEQ